MAEYDTWWLLSFFQSNPWYVEHVPDEALGIDGYHDPGQLVVEDLSRLSQHRFSFQSAMADYNEREKFKKKDEVEDFLYS